MDELITALIATGASAVSALVTFLLARRKYNAEVTSTEYENFAKMIASYRDTIEDNQRRLDRYQAEIENVATKKFLRYAPKTAICGISCKTFHCKSSNKHRENDTLFVETRMAKA